MKYRVKIRRDIGGVVKPNAEKIDGMVFNFRKLWDMDEKDPYPGEVAMMADDETYPDYAPTWISSGDLEAV